MLLHAGPGFNQLVVDTATQCAGAIVGLQRRTSGGRQYVAAASQCQGQQYGCKSDHSSLPNS